MRRSWADALESPDGAAQVMTWRDDLAPRHPSNGERKGDERPAAGRHSTRRAAVRRRRLAGLLLVFVVAVALVVVATSLLRSDDAFSGVWWEPDSGRRVEIVREGESFTLLYGAERRPFAAERRGDELVIAAPLGGDIVVRAVAADRLELDDGGRTTTLEPVPDGS